MCIAILNTKKAGRLPNSHIKNSWDNNDMGSGLLWTENGKLKVYKTYKYDDYIDKYNKLRDNRDVGNIVLHFRIATSGYKGEHNLHPFLVNDELGFVHNGVIKGLGNQKLSDTYEFNDMLKKFKHDFISCDMTKYFISEYIGYSKLIFLAADDRYTIINEELGKWTDGNWYSNDSYKQYNDYSWYGNTKVSKSSKANDIDWDAYEFDTYNGGYTINKDEIDYNTDDEWLMYDYICNVYGLDANDESAWDDVDYYMTLSGANDIPELYKMLTEEYN